MCSPKFVGGGEKSIEGEVDFVGVIRMVVVSGRVCGGWRCGNRLYGRKRCGGRVYDGRRCRGEDPRTHEGQVEGGEEKERKKK